MTTTKTLLLPKARYTGSPEAEKDCYQHLIQYLGYLYPKPPNEPFLSLPKAYRDDPSRWITESIDYCMQFEMAETVGAFNWGHRLFFSVLMRDFSIELMEQVVNGYERAQRPLPDDRAYSLYFDHQSPSYLSGDAIRYLAVFPYIDLNTHGTSLLYHAFFHTRDLSAARALLDNGVRIRDLPKVEFNPVLCRLRNDNDKPVLYGLFLALVEELRKDGIHPDDPVASLEGSHIPLLFTATQLNMTSVVTLLVGLGADPRRKSGFQAAYSHDGSVVNTWWYNDGCFLDGPKQQAMFDALKVTPSDYQQYCIDHRDEQRGVA